MKRLRDLTNDDLKNYPIWRYEGDSDDAAFVFPAMEFADPDQLIYIARTRFVSADGSEWWGYCSPTDDSGLDYVQPVILASGAAIRFWCDQPLQEPEPERAYRILGRQSEQIFPAWYECMVPFEGRLVAGELTQLKIMS